MGVIIIAEAGVNHNGSLELAKKLIDAAADAGADYVKFQTFKAEKVAGAAAPKAEYQKKTTRTTESQLDMLRKLELNEEHHQILIDYCAQRNIRFLSTPFDFDSIGLLHKLGLDTFKIPSGELNHLPYLREIAKYNKKVILSTGMADLGEVEDNLNVLIENGTDKENITILHCHAEYPSRMEDLNLRAMQSMQAAFKTKVGYSDHSNGIEACVAAVAMGACLVEKHFTLDKNMEGPDHKASLEPDELKAMVQAIRNIEKAMGDGIKRPSAIELKNKTIMRKSIHYSRSLSAGHVLQADDLIMKRPENGVSPMEMDNLIGKPLLVAVEADHMFHWSEIQL